MTAVEMPEGLGDAGASLWSDVLSVYVLQPHELRLLAVACRLADETEILEAALSDSEPVVAGSMGQPRANPLYAEIRAHRLSFLRTVGALALPDPKGGVVKSPAQLQSVGAANSRWRAQRRSEGVRFGDSA